MNITKKPFDTALPFSGFGLVKLKREGDIADPDEFDWEHDPHEPGEGSCRICKERYAKWKLAYDKQEADRGSLDGTRG